MHAHRCSLSRSEHRVAGTSLIELLVVVSLILILFTLYFGGGSRGFQQRQITNCGKNLENIYVALKIYGMDHDDKLPNVPDAKTSESPLSQLVPRYTTGTHFFICPGSHDHQLPDAEPFANRRISYAYYMGAIIGNGAAQPLLSDRQVNTQPKEPGEALFSPDGKKPGNNHNRYGGNVMFCDGNVQTSPANAAFALTNLSPATVLLNPKP